MKYGKALLTYEKNTRQGDALRLKLIGDAALCEDLQLIFGELQQIVDESYQSDPQTYALLRAGIVCVYIILTDFIELKVFKNSITETLQAFVNDFGSLFGKHFIVEETAFYAFLSLAKREKESSRRDFDLQSAQEVIFTSKLLGSKRKADLGNLLSKACGKR